MKKFRYPSISMKKFKITCLPYSLYILMMTWMELQQWTLSPLYYVTPLWKPRSNCPQQVELIRTILSPYKIYWIFKTSWGFFMFSLMVVRQRWMTQNQNWQKEPLNHDKFEFSHFFCNSGTRWESEIANIFTTQNKTK